MLAIAGFEEVMAQCWYYKLDYKDYSDPLTYHETGAQLLGWSPYSHSEHTVDVLCWQAADKFLKIYLMYHMTKVWVPRVFS